MKTVAKVLSFQNNDWTTDAMSNKIEPTLNNVIADMEKRNYHLLSINVNTVDINHHNNGGANTVDLVYTLVFRFDLHL